jgi:hypothetical protein
MSVSGARNFADPFKRFLGLKTDIFCHGSASFLAPETDVMGQFLGQETDTFHQFLVPMFFSRILATRKRKRKFEQALDYVQ